ncbi:helix-turn-helix domain-containing protein [Actinomadura hibisca]|uniref:helix-turn-helix domain-containing protein n=1 Tax=Actinomadura hibisca TaxID=68565 RepID=UPI000B0F11DE|nr:helix-turn-helix domain-containing protein [Actinomadura hibisca]
MTASLDERAFTAISGRAGEVLRTALDGLPGPEARRLGGLLADPGSGRERLMAHYRTAGRDLTRDGHEPAAAHRALREAALTAWHTVTDLLDTLDLDHGTLRLVVEAQFGYLEAVTEAVAEGCRDATRESAENLRRQRARLLALLLAEPPADPTVLGPLAAAAGWPIPRRVAAVALCRRDAGQAARRPGSHRRTNSASNAGNAGNARSAAANAGNTGSAASAEKAAPHAVATQCPIPLEAPDGALVDFSMPEPALLLPDPGPSAGGDAVADALKPLVRDWTVAVGPPVPAARAAESLRWARDTLTLARRGLIDDTGLICGAEHLPALVVFRAGELIEDAAQTRLAPLRALSPAQRDRLTRTLRVLLEHNFNAVQAGRRLRLHPQTVRYRLRQLQALFGDDLRDPRRCLELELILRAGPDQRDTGGAPGSPVP